MNLKFPSEKRVEYLPAWRASGPIVRSLLVPLAIVLFISSSAMAQFSNVEYFQNLDQSSTPSATDILSRRTTVGRFGAVTRGGWLSPSPNTNRRFNEGAVYTPSGGFVGMSTNSPNSRFQAWWNESQVLPSTDYSIYSDFLSVKRGNDPYGPMPANTPRQVQALPPQPASTTAAMVPSQRESGQTLAGAGPARTQPIRTSGTTEQIWMRDKPATSAQPVPHSSVPAPNTLPAAGQNRPEGIDLGSRLVGNIANSNMTENVPDLGYPLPGATASRGAPTATNTRQQQLLQHQLEQEQAAQSLIQQQQLEQRRMAGTQVEQYQASQGVAPASIEAIQTSLEQILLQHPGVHPLSPIQVQFRDGVATVRGIVPSQTNRIEAGRVLLSDPRVKTVANLLTVLPANTQTPLPPAFDPALEKASKVTPGQASPSDSATRSPNTVPEKTDKNRP